jgi:hypothetical protein
MECGVHCPLVMAPQNRVARTGRRHDVMGWLGLHFVIVITTFIFFFVFP